MSRDERIRNVVDDALFASIINHKGLQRKASDELTKLIREICGLE